MDAAFHYPPDLVQLLIDTVPLLCRSKDDVLLFFHGAGVPVELSKDVADRLRADRVSVNKYDIARTVVVRLNERGDATIRERREVIKRVVEFEDFSRCWPDDQMKAKGLVAEVQRVLNVKDSFTRLNQERQRERTVRLEAQEAEAQKVKLQRATLDGIKNDLFGLFIETNAQVRGKKLEPVLNRLFKSYGISVREDFTRSGTVGEGVLEQIDGVIELDGRVYLTEMKWWASPLGPAEVSPHIVKVYNRGNQVGGLIISYSPFTAAAIKTCEEALVSRP